MMTKRNFKPIADIIAEHLYFERTHLGKRSGEYRRFNDFQNCLMHYFKADNPRFDAGRFNAYIEKRCAELDTKYTNRTQI